MKVEIWSDLACPWCYIGKRRFEQALESFEHRDAIAIVYRSFELNPDTPADFTGSELDYLCAHKGISADDAAGLLKQVTKVAESVGLHYRFDLVRHANTFDAHRLIQLAGAQGRGVPMVERLFAAYFIEGESLADLSTLARLAGEVELDADAILVALTNGAGADEVRADEAQAQEYGIDSVPFFVLDEKYGVPGAQEPSVLLEVLEQAWAERASERDSEPAR